jgi:hypothetical protein
MLKKAWGLFWARSANLLGRTPHPTPGIRIHPQNPTKADPFSSLAMHAYQVEIICTPKQRNDELPKQPLSEMACAAANVFKFNQKPPINHPAVLSTTYTYQ